MMLGHCFVFSESDGFSRPERIIPLEGKPVFFGREGYANAYSYGTVYSQLGMALLHGEDHVAFGAPGTWNWTGSLTV